MTIPNNGVVHTRCPALDTPGVRKAKDMKTRLIMLLAVCVVHMSCAHLPSTGRSDLISVTLEDVPVLDAIRMSKQIGSGPHFSGDSLSGEALTRIRVSIDVKDVTVEEYLRQVAQAASLNLEMVNDAGLLRVTRKAR